MAHIFTQELFELKPLIKSIDIKLCTHGKNGVKQILAIITENNEIVLHYCYGELTPVLKRIPWISDCSKSINAICFDPTATWLLVVCLDSSLYILPALYLVDKKQKIDCKWSATDITGFSKTSPSSNYLPTCCSWWQTLESNQNALIGFSDGNIILVSLTDGRVLGGYGIPHKITKLHVCLDNLKETVSLLINTDTDCQYRLILEHHASGYTWPTDTSNVHLEESVRSRFSALKQIGVDKLVSLRQRLGARKDSQNDPVILPTQTQPIEAKIESFTLPPSDTSSTLSSCQWAETYQASLPSMFMNSYASSESSASINIGSWKSNSSSKISTPQYGNSGCVAPELMPQFADTFFTPQTCRNRCFFSALYRPTGLLTIHAADFDTAPIYVYRVLPKTRALILTDNLIYTLNQDLNMITVVSCQLSESRLEGETEFNEDSLVAEFCIENEDILEFFKTADLSIDITPNQNYKNKFHHSKNKNDMAFLKPSIDTCVIVTNKTVYKVSLKCTPIQKFIDCVTEDNDLEKAEKLAYIFSLNLQQLLEHCGDIMVTRGAFHSGIILYKQAKVHLLKRVLKLAASTDCKTLLKFVHLCLNASRIDMNISTRIHIGNVAVMAYVELLLRHCPSEQVRVNHTKDFMNFVVHESYFDAILAVNMACQAGHWNIVNVLSKSRGLQPEAVIAFGKILLNDFIHKPLNLDFLYALSEPCLTPSLLILPQSSQVIFQYIRENINSFPIEILNRFTVQLDPSQPCAIPFLRAIFQNNKNSSDTNLESFDYETADRCTIVIKDLVETFLFVIMNLAVRTNRISFSLDMLEMIVPDEKTEDGQLIRKLPDLKILSCGYEHAAVIRNNSVYTMGVATSGCLGTGPMLTNTSGPRLVNTLLDLKVTPLSVSCGKKHTLCATDCGVFAWGSNSYGQLGLGPHLQETPYPQLITSISHLKIVDIAAGQYHSIALTHSGKVYTWGWGIHGQLGHGSTDNEYYPTLVNFHLPVRQVSAGHAHSLMLTCDGQVYGFGSNVFAQLEKCNIDSKKSTVPTWVVLMPDMYIAVDKIATSYFHNMAVTIDQKVYMWGASPEEVRFLQQRSSQKQNGTNITLQNESWKSAVEMYHSQTRRPIKQVAVGYRHCAILDQGRILWGKNKDEDLNTPILRDAHDGIMGHRFSHVSCGLDYTMAIDHTGQVLVWGTPAMIETILGVSMEPCHKKYDEKTVIFKNTKRLFRSPHVNAINNFPIEISVLPSAAFTFNPINHKMLLSNKCKPYDLMSADNNDMSQYWAESKKIKEDFKHIFRVPELNIGQNTVHYTLQTFVDFYDVENVIKRGTDEGDFQAASKASYLKGHYVDSLGFAIEGFKRHLTKMDIDLPSLFTCKDSYDVKEKDEGIEIIVESIKSELDKGKTSNCNSPARILSSSSSLDSLRQFGEEGGRESPCEGDVRQNISNYVQAIKKSDSSQFKTSKLNESYKDVFKEKSIKHKELEIKNKQAKEVLDMASYIVEFYIRKIYLSENHILMQNILLKCMEFWLSHNLPVVVLEDILLKNLDKYFYPLSILLFCKNFDEDDLLLKKNDDVVQISSSGFLKEFSTKFCLHLCSMVLENANKS